MPVPQDGERPTVYADRVGAWYVGQKSDEHRKAYGLYLTPVPVADFMASRLHVDGGRSFGFSIPPPAPAFSCCAAVEALVCRDPKPDTIELVTYEVEGNLIAPLRAVLSYPG